MFAFFKGYNYVSNLIFMFGWSGLHLVLRMTHLEAAPTHKEPPSPPVPAKPNILYIRGMFVDIVCWTVG